MASATPRRFKVEPIETTVRSSKSQPVAESTESSTSMPRFTPELLEATKKTNRKFSPQPLETTARTNCKAPVEPAEDPASVPNSTSDSLHTAQMSNRSPAPEPIATSPKSSREKFAEEWGQPPSPRSPRAPVSGTTSFLNRRTKPILRRPPGRFSPQLIETAQRSRKANDVAPTLMPSDKTDATPDVISSRTARILGITPTVPMNTPTKDVSQNPLFLEIQQAHATCPLSRRRSYFEISQHSFRVPELDTIDSSESEASAPPSPTISSWTTSDHSFMYKEATRRRESVDDRSSGYLLELAAKAAEKQLREQAMAAFPNSDIHEHVAHYVDRDTDDTESNAGDVKENKNTSFTEVNWELEDMQKYQDKQRAEKEKQNPADRPDRSLLQRKPAHNPFGKSPRPLDAETVKKLADDRTYSEMERMRESARPPMLGKEIKFPRCASPEPSRFDPTQGCDAVRTAMCYLSEQTRAASEKGESLWCGQGNGRQTSTTPSLWSTANSRASSTHGLWGGMCVNAGDKSPRGPTGILTPMHGIATPLSPCPTPAMSLLPPTPPASTTDFSGIDEKLAIEQTITEDFSDDFVTQVYNYLSLGYPSMARPFDTELSKISMIPIYELRQDDHLAGARGYIRLGKGGNLTDTVITEETCVRWRALRIYIQEWARQHPNMAEEEFPVGGRGATVRKGSWAV
jgi:hypothetical protein